ncbi:MAG: hypothetical protein NTW96_27365, partial [Planctomycetia bacterium]|nr:hypothetical protein [Planctomycetia bacterium]
MQRTNPTDPTLPEAAGLPSSDPACTSVADITCIAGIELVLRQIIQAVSEGRDDRVGPFVDRLGALFESLTPADRTAANGADGAATLQDLQRVSNLWKQTALAIASASQQASAELQHIAVGRSTLRAYRP